MGWCHTNTYTQIYRHIHSHLHTNACVFTVTEMTSYYENPDVCTTHSKTVCGISIIHVILMTLSCTSVGCVCTCTCLHAVKWEEKAALQTWAQTRVLPLTSWVSLDSLFDPTELLQRRLIMVLEEPLVLHEGQSFHSIPRKAMVEAENSCFPFTWSFTPPKGPWLPYLLPECEWRNWPREFSPVQGLPLASAGSQDTCMQKVPLQGGSCRKLDSGHRLAGIFSSPASVAVKLRVWSLSGWLWYGSPHWFWALRCGREWRSPLSTPAFPGLMWWFKRGCGC